MNPQWMIISIHQDFYKNIDKLLRDNYKYVQCCLLCLIETVSSNQIPTMLSTIKESFGQMMNGALKHDLYKSNGLKQVAVRNEKEFGSIKGGLMYIITVNEMISSSSFKSKICKKELILVLAYLFENCEFQKNNKQLDEFRTCLFQILESMAKNTKLLITNSKDIMDTLLPAIVKKIESDSADVRF